MSKYIRILTTPCADASYTLVDEDSNSLGTGTIPSGINDNITAPNASVDVEKTDGTLIENESILSGGSSTITIPDTVVTIAGGTINVMATDPLTIPIKDMDGNVVGSTLVGGEVIISDLPCSPSGDGTIEIYDTDGTLIFTGPVTPETTLTHTIADSTAVLRDTGGNIISTTSIVAEGSEDIIAPDGTVNIVDSNSTPIGSVTVPSGGSDTFVVNDLPVVCLDASYEVEYANGTPIESGTIPSGGSKTIIVPDAVICDDATVTNGTTYVDTVASGGTLLLPNENITVNGNLLVNKPSVEDYDVEVVDSDDNAVSTSIIGGKVVIDDLPCGSTPAEGIAYQEPNGYNIYSTSYADYDAAWRAQNNALINVRPINPLYEQQLDFNSADPFNTLLYNNIHGNKHRFTDSSGLPTAFTVNEEFQDHLTGRFLFNLTGYTNYRSWVDFMNYCYNNFGMFAPTMDEFWSLKNTQQSAIVINGGNVPIDSNYRNWTCNVDESNPTQSIRMNSQTYPIESASGTSRGGFMIKLFHPISNP